jgi:hypothetical protein
MGWLRGGLFRGVLLAVAAAVAAGVYLAHEYVRPERVREVLLATLREKLPGVDVQVESARLRLLGGITVEGLTLTKPGAAVPFFVAPQATVAHDKESLTRGELQIRRIELHNPTLRLHREADGSWDVQGLLPTPPAGGGSLAPIPTVIVTGATVYVTDGRPQPLPPLKLTHARLHLLNDPLAVFKVEAAFTLAPLAEGAGGAGGAGGFEVPMTLTAKYHRIDKSVTARVEVPELAMVPDLAPAFAKIDPTLADYLSQFRATLSIKADVKVEPGADPKYDVKVDVRDGHFADPALPWPLEHVTGSLQVQDGKLTVEKATARFGKATAELTLETKPLCPKPADHGGEPPAAQAEGDTLYALEARVERLQVTLRQLTLDDEFFAKLPPRAHRIRRMFKPEGAVDVVASLAQSPTGVKRELEVRPSRAGMTYEKFPYPVRELTGTVKLVEVPGGSEFRVQVTGTASERRVELTGRVGSAGPDPLIDLKLTGIDFPIDDKLFAAMPPKYAASLGRLHAGGRGDFSVQIHQPQDVNRCETTVQVSVHDASATHTAFPYPLRNIRGRITVRIAATAKERPVRPGTPLTPMPDSDRVEIRGFEAAHAGGKLWVDGDSEPVTGTPHRRLALTIKGDGLPFDDDFRAGVEALRASSFWTELKPEGAFTFGADVEVLERGVPAGSSPGTPEPAFFPPTDLKLAVKFTGPTLTPQAFPYRLDGVSGVVRYAQGKLDLVTLAAHHKGTSLGLDAAEVRFGADGEVWANVGGVAVGPLSLDADVLAALPPTARVAAAGLNFRGRADLSLRQLVISLPGKGGATPVPEPTAPPQVARGQSADAAAPANAPEPVVYWDGELKLFDAAFDVGTALTDLTGAVASRGKYDGGHLGTVLGNAWFDRVTLARQPLTNVKVSYAVRAQRPDPARPGSWTPAVMEFPDLTANLFHGTIGGAARVVPGGDGGTAFRLLLNASGVRLDELAKLNKLGGDGELRGLAQGKVELEAAPDPRTGLATLTGTGQIDVPNGRLYNLPVLMPLLKLFKLQTPDQTAFEEAHALFEVRGDRVRVTQLDLIGTALSLGGSGELSASGQEVRFEFYTVWSQALRRWLTTPLGDVTSFLSGNLFKIEMVRTAGRPMEYRPQMLPVITEPVKAVAERLRGRLPAERNYASAPDAPAPIQQ